MTRSRLIAIAALPALLLFGAGKANAARPLLAELLARAPVAAGKPAMSALTLEACLRQARELDATGTAIDYEIARQIETYETGERYGPQHQRMIDR